VIEDKTIIMLNVLHQVSEGLYEGLNTTREQQVLALQGVLDRLRKSEAKNQELLDRCTRIAEMHLPGKLS